MQISIVSRGFCVYTVHFDIQMTVNKIHLMKLVQVIVFIVADQISEFIA